MSEEDKKYIAENLSIDWVYDEKKGQLYLGLIFDGEIISKVKFEQY